VAGYRLEHIVPVLVLTVGAHLLKAWQSRKPAPQKPPAAPQSNAQPEAPASAGSGRLDAALRGDFDLLGADERPP
jgi:hypothetical protein